MTYLEKCQKEQQQEEQSIPSQLLDIYDTGTMVSNITNLYAPVETNNEEMYIVDDEPYHNPILKNMTDDDMESNMDDVDGLLVLLFKKKIRFQLRDYLAQNNQFQLELDESFDPMVWFYQEDLFEEELNQDDKELNTFHQGMALLHGLEAQAQFSGNANLQLIVGHMYKYSLHDLRVAQDWYQLAADQGHAKAQFEIGKMWYLGQAMPQHSVMAENYRMAMRWYSRAANQGDANAQYHLGNMYLMGEGLLTNYKAAMRWFRLASKQDHAQAQRQLGHMYLKGQAVRRNDVTGKQMLKMAAHNGDLQAQECFERYTRKAFQKMALYDKVPCPAQLPSPLPKPKPRPKSGEPRPPILKLLRITDDKRHVEVQLDPPRRYRLQRKNRHRFNVYKYI